MTVTIVNGVTADNAVDASQITGTVSVAHGGTGDTSLTAYAVLAGGTTSTGPVQSVASVGTSGQVLTSNGAGQLPTFQAASGGAAGSLTGTTLAANVVNSSLTTVGTITSGTWNGTAVDVTHGGTGRASHTAYAVLCGGTTSTGAQQSIASVGTAGQILVSNGAGALPTFETPGAAISAINLVNSSTACTVTDSTGRITYPAQPKFWAYMTGTQDNVTGDGTAATLICDSTSTNVGSCYNTSTGEFTAPVTAFYHFDLAISMNHDTSTHNQGHIRIVHGGNGDYIWFGNPYLLNYSGNNFNQFNVSFNYQIAANDKLTVTIAVFGGTKTVDFEAGTIFSGYIVG